MSIFNELLSNMLGILQKERKIIYLNGDFNVNINPSLKGTSSTMQEFKNIMSTNYLYPLITKPTRITEHSATLIDNIYCNISNLAET